MATTRIKKIAPLQFGKMLAVIYGLLALVIVPFFVLFSVVSAMAGMATRGGGAAALMGVGMSLFMMVALPLLYAAFGFIFGVIGAFIYNVVAKWIGGIEVDLEAS